VLADHGRHDVVVSVERQPLADIAVTRVALKAVVQVAVGRLAGSVGCAGEGEPMRVRWSGGRSVPTCVNAVLGLCGTGGTSRELVLSFEKLF
jgi:hypothetical protein